MDMAVLPEPTQRVFLWRWVWLALTLACLIGVVVGYLLWGTTTADHRDAFDTGWKSAAAVLAVLATFIAVDRLRISQREQYRQLIVAHLTQRDLVARQITDLSAKASEQLGSDKAAVRIGGLTDLERLAQSHPELRQTVVDRLCAYLRAPFDPPDATTSDDVAGRLELDVRRTVQRILARHLRWPADIPEQPASFWEDINLDLRDAVVVDLDLDQCRVGDADFVNARLHGHTTVRKATVANALFMGATFSGRADFNESTVTRYANFIKANFADAAVFARATFATAGFSDATFSGHAIFSEATFTEDAVFDHASVAEDGYFAMATFAGKAWFNSATFAENAEFAGATFAGETSFNGVTFTGKAWFGEATCLGGAGVDPAIALEAARVWGLSSSLDLALASSLGQETARLPAHVVVLPSRVDRVPAARFDGTLSMENARVTDPQQGHSWPPGWRAKRNRDDPDGPHLLIPQKTRKITAAP